LLENAGIQLDEAFRKPAESPSQLDEAFRKPAESLSQLDEAFRKNDYGVYFRAYGVYFTAGKNISRLRFSASRRKA
jgi:hypothetical protein